MIFARVVGTVVSTNKEPELVGKKLLLVQPVEPAGTPKGSPLVAVDAVGSGEGEFVLLVQGSSARQTTATEGNPVDCVVVAIVDTVELNGKAVFEKSKDKETSKR